MINLARNVKITRVLNAVAAGQTTQNGGVIAIQYGTRILPVTQDTTVAGIETHVPPVQGTA